MCRVTVQRWVGSAVGSGVLDSDSPAPTLYFQPLLQAKGKWHSQGGSAEWFPLREAKPGSWGRGSRGMVQAMGEIGLLGVLWISLVPCGKAQGLALSLPACPPGCWLPHGASGAPIAWLGPLVVPGDQVPACSTRGCPWPWAGS